MGNSKSKSVCFCKSAPSQKDNESNTSELSKSNGDNLPDMSPNNNCVRLREIPEEFLNLDPNELINEEDENKEDDDGDEATQFKQTQDGDEQ